ncbi:hypothetical protein GCM10007898_24860 [Dyella flagellata]|uniref:Uncharacterized protein n=1 Tax=Dyella flagellata TaxID=1867833 RepID=A0ABQ5XB55_9GAMM|nr:hypothetical protein GCM10007898_24860 [Dyella flagellata]
MLEDARAFGQRSTRRENIIEHGDVIRQPCRSEQRKCFAQIAATLDGIQPRLRIGMSHPSQYIVSASNTKRTRKRLGQFKSLVVAALA